MPREIHTSTRHPALVAACIDLLEFYASGDAPKTDLQKAVYEGLRKSDPDRTISKRQIGHFARLPKKITTPVFGRRRSGQFLDLSDEQLENIFQRPDTDLILFDDVGDPIIPEFPPNTQFTILYTGLYCRDRTGDRKIFGPSDEPYVVTVAVSITGGQNVERAERHPVGDPDGHYGDVDDGEWRTGPIAACWSGPEPNTEISLVSVVMENDEGDPDAYRRKFGTS